MSVFKKTQPPVVGLPEPKSVASITAGLWDTLTELQDHADQQAAHAKLQQEMADRALVARDEHDAEAAQARKVAGNIKALLGA